MNKSIMIGIFSISSLMYGGCVQDGMNLWRLTENVSCSVGVVCEIKQADITPGVLFIDNPGHYKLCENVVGPAQITIRASDVILDLGGYVTDGVVINVNDDIQNITIKNGTMKNMIFGVDININVRNVLIEDLVIDTLVPNGGAPTLNFAFRIANGPVTGVTLRNVSIYNGCPQNILFSGLDPDDYITDIVLENVSCIGTNSVYTAELQLNKGIVYISAARNVVLNNVRLIDQIGEAPGIVIDTCQVVNIDGAQVASAGPVPASPKNALSLLTSNDIVIQNSMIDGGVNRVYVIGFAINGNVTFVTVENCSATLTARGFFCEAELAAVYKNCSSYNNTLDGFLAEGHHQQFINCLAYENARHGFQVQINFDDELFEGCIADHNAQNGFNFNLPGGFPTAKVICSSCIANRNGQHGFATDSHGIFSSCEATNNTLNGFNILGNGIVPYHNVVLYQCLASTNLGSGINNVSANVFIVDTRSSSTVAPVYQLNQVADVFGGATIVNY